jgi:DNA-binding MarR family transcriptional regulator
LTLQVFVKELLGDGLSTRQAFAWSGFLRVYTKLIRQLDGELRSEQRLALPAYEVLLLLALAPERKLQLSALASSMLLSLSGTSRLVERLERTGLVHREVDEQDHRITNAILTDTGFDRLCAAHAVHMRGIREHFLCHFTPLDLTLLTLFWKRFTRGEVGRIEDAIEQTKEDTTQILFTDLPAPVNSRQAAEEKAPRGRGRPRKGGTNAPLRKGFEVTFDARTLALLDSTTDNRSEYLERVALQHLLAQNQELTRECMLELHQRYAHLPGEVAKKLQEIEYTLGVMAAYEASEAVLLFEPS